MRPTMDTRTTRRGFLAKAAYVAPTILTLPAVLSIASAGSHSAPPKVAAPPPAGGGNDDDDGGSCTAWWHIFFCFPPWKGNIF
jgi:hypothetical protein